MDTSQTPADLWRAAIDTEAMAAVLTGHDDPAGLASWGGLRRKAYNQVRLFILGLERLVRRILIAVAATLAVDAPRTRAKPARRPDAAERAPSVCFRLWQVDPAIRFIRPRAPPAPSPLLDWEDALRLPIHSIAWSADYQARRQALMRPVSALARRWLAVQRVLDDPHTALARAARSIARWRARLASNSPMRMKPDNWFAGDDPPGGLLRDTLAAADRLARGFLDAAFAGRADQPDSS